MRILMTGATGFVGKKLGQELVRAGHEVFVLSRDPQRAEAELPFPCRAFAWNATSEQAPAAAFNGVHAIVHLAGEPVAQRWNEASKKRIYESRILGTKHLLEGLASSVHAASVQAFVCATAIGIYGDRGDELLNESSQPGNDFLAHVCRDWEASAKVLSELRMRRVCLRIGIVLGRDGGALEKMLPVFRAGLGGPVGSGKQWMSWIHVDDLVALFMEAVLNPKFDGSYNAVAPRPVMNSEFTRTLGKTLKRPAFFRAPALGLKLALGEMASVVLASQRASAERVLSLGFRFRYKNLEQALQEILG